MGICRGGQGMFGGLLFGLLVSCAAALQTGGMAGPPTGIGPNDWPCWRGPTHDGQSRPGQAPPLSWSDTENVVWSADVPGRGNGSPTVVGGRVYLATCDEASGSQSVLAFDRGTGRRVWERIVHPRGAMRKNQKSTGASATVACDGERLYITFPNSDAVFASALDLDGTIVWQTKLGAYLIHQGYGASPLVHGGRVFVVADHRGGGAVAALDPKSGAVVWKQDRPPMPNYASPVVFTIGGREQLILIGCEQVIAHDPATGATLWRTPGSTTECVTTTVTDGTRIYSSGGYPKNHVAAIRADGSGKVDWENGERLYVPSLLYRDGHLYAVLDAGIAVCWDAATGAEKWKRRLGGNFSSSPVMLGDTVFATSEAGETHVFRATPEAFAEVGLNRLGDESFATPAICGDRIFLRVASTRDGTRQERLVCVGRPADPAESRPAADAALADKPRDAEPPQPAGRSTRTIEGFTVLVDDRLLAGGDAAEVGAEALAFLTAKLAEIRIVVPPERLAELRRVRIVLDASCGGLKTMQYHPSADWLEKHGYPRSLEKCVHLPRAADLATRRNINQQPWVILHELAHAYHDQVLGFDEPRVLAAWKAYTEGGKGEATLLYDGSRVRHYGLTDQKEFFAEMTEAYFGSNDFHPFNRAELKTEFPDLFALLQEIWGPVRR